MQLTDKINQFLLNDPSASFSFYRGHVVSFSARPKKTIPDYALPVLLKYDLSTSVNDIHQLGIAEKPKSGKTLDADLIRKMPVHYERSKANANFDPNQDDEADACTDDDAKYYKRTKRNRLQAPGLWQRPHQDVLD
ncbi:MAG: hypothetical protein WBO73_11940 [Gammaproteobacteria bacterium]